MAIFIDNLYVFWDELDKIQLQHRWMRANSFTEEEELYHYKVGDFFEIGLFLNDDKNRIQLTEIDIKPKYLEIFKKALEERYTHKLSRVLKMDLWENPKDGVEIYVKYNSKNAIFEFYFLSISKLQNNS